jgi:hypothetical protein
LLAAEVLRSNPRVLFGRYLWIDELQTKLVASEPSIWQSLAAVAHSGDLTPPEYHLLARASWGLLGGSAEIAFRILSIVAMWVALVLLYVLLRRSFAILPAVVAVLAFWSNSQIIYYGFFYARPYAPLLAVTVGFCLIYGLDNKRPLAIALTAVMAALVCTLHYFGIFALASVVLGDTLARREPLSAMIRRWLPAAAGPIALASCWPFSHSWKNGGTILSCFPPLTLSFAAGSFGELLQGTVEPIALLVLALSISFLVRLRTRLVGNIGEERTVSIGPLQPVAGLLGLILLPIFVAVFSALTSPAMTTRYMLPGLLGVTALLAILASKISPRILTGTAMLLILLGAWHLRLYGDGQARWQATEEQMMNIGQNDQLAIVTLDRHEAYLLYAYAPRLRDRLFIADLRHSHGSSLSRCLMVDYDSEDKWSRVYPDLPKLVSLDQLRDMGKFHLVNSEVTILADQELQPDQSFPLEKIAQALSFQKVGDLYEVRPN